ncbi:hypothetical protein FZEAL_4082 [Fusarium zealandicum]|uniref:F-box domain-containing protein n=1 Tax=Fusarium zealandicum TaxID=1053134 RepID=A0A8H4UMK4_9HYPO|nr:hypothetical protein FZEAL_4082 [Fusarium zealandicum]
MDKDITSLMMASFAGTARDEFGRGQDRRRSLLLDTVMGNRQRVSRSLFLQLPAEILADIVDLLADDASALACLAIVNSDCRQLARCCQFAEVHLDYSLQAKRLTLDLVQDFAKGQQSTVGASVRRVTFASSASHVADSHPEVFDTIWGEAAHEYSHEQRKRLRELANKQYKVVQTGAISAISLAMPNLETLIWEDRFALDQYFFASIFRSSARHVKLNNIFIDAACSVEPSLCPATWPLCSLDLYTYITDHERQRTSADPSTSITLFETIFRLCAATIESLSWKCMFISDGSEVSLGSNPPSFPRLRCLRLRSISLDRIAFSSLIASPLRHLELSLKPSWYWDCISCHESLRYLESFVVDDVPLENESCSHIADFISQHDHLQKLCLHDKRTDAGHVAHLDRYIIPALGSGSFSHLSCLSLAWGGGSLSLNEPMRPHETHVSEESLATIGKITSLEKLSLCSGVISGWRNQWLVDHTKLRTHLRGLIRLRILALSRDTYKYTCPRTEFDPVFDRYYSDQILGPEERTDAQNRPELDVDDTTGQISELEITEHDQEDDDENGWRITLWERAHRNRMLVHAEAYAVLLPKLEWMLCGQRPIGFQPDLQDATAPRKAVPLTKERDECYTFLRKTFALGED